MLGMGILANTLREISQENFLVLYMIIHGIKKLLVLLMGR
jgi:uncharacterized membrane protein